MDVTELENRVELLEAENTALNNLLRVSSLFSSGFTNDSETPINFNTEGLCSVTEFAEKKGITAQAVTRLCRTGAIDSFYVGSTTHQNRIVILSPRTLRYEPGNQGPKRKPLLE